MSRMLKLILDWSAGLGSAWPPSPVDIHVKRNTRLNVKGNMATHEPAPVARLLSSNLALPEGLPHKNNLNLHAIFLLLDAYQCNLICTWVALSLLFPSAQGFLVVHQCLAKWPGPAREQYCKRHATILGEK